MHRAAALSFLAMLSTSACTVSTTTVTPLSPLETESLVRPPGHASAVVATFESDGHLVSGHVESRQACRVAVQRTERYERARLEKPFRAAGVLAGVAAVAAGTAGFLVLEGLDDFSNRSRCDDDGTDTGPCGSDRADAAGLGLLLASGAVALTAVSIATLASRRTRVSKEVLSTPPGPARVLTPPVACGTGSVSGLGVSLWRFDERLAATTTDAFGNAALALPAGITGTLRVVADSTPPSHPLVVPGETLAWVQVEPAPVAR
jgi:hypothetical protein